MKKLTAILIAFLSGITFTACEGLVPEEGTMVDGYAVVDDIRTWDQDSSDVAIKASTCTTPFTPEHRDYSIPGMQIPEVANQTVTNVNFSEGAVDNTDVADCRVQLVLEQGGTWDCQRFNTSVLSFVNLNDGGDWTCVADFNLTR